MRILIEGPYGELESETCLTSLRIANLHDQEVLEALDRLERGQTLAEHLHLNTLRVSLRDHARRLDEYEDAL